MLANTQIPNSKFQVSQLSLIISLICLHLLIVLPLAYVLNIWADEASTLHTTQFGFSHALQHALADEIQAPFYFWFLSLWREISGSIFFARLFSVVCSCCAIKIFGDLARRVFERRTAIWATFFFAVHPYLIWASLEIRVYALVILLSISLLKIFDALYLTEKTSAEKPGSAKTFRLQILFIFLAALALYTNYYLGFLLVGCFAALVLRQNWRGAGVYLLQMFIAGIAFLPLVWSVKSQFAVNTSGFQADRPFAEGLRILWNILLTFVLPTEIFTTGDASTVSVFRLWLARLGILAAIILLLKNRHRLSANIVVFGAISAVVSGFLFAAYFMLGGDYVGVRHTAILFAPFVLFLFSILDEISKPKKFNEKTDVEREAEKFSGATPRFAASFIPLPTIFTVVALGFFAYSIYSLYPNLTKRGDWARIAVYLENNEKPNQPIIIFTTFDALALPYYYHGANRVLPDERFFDFELEAESGSAESWRGQTDFIISKIPPDAPEIWLLNNDKCAVKDACLPLENFVESNYTVIEEKEFNSETVRLLRKK